jgi:photoactive yellow protein
VTSPFSPFDLDKAMHLTGGDLDQLPFGVIAVNSEGDILDYNSYERTMANMGSRTVIGLNFFRDVAPCTAIQEFQGRFTDFLKSPRTSIEPFEFVFPFARGPQRVNVVFVREAGTSERATICVIRTEVAEKSSA